MEKQEFVGMLVKAANELDDRGMHKEASEIDGLIKEAVVGRLLGRGLKYLRDWGKGKGKEKPPQLPNKRWFPTRDEMQGAGAAIQGSDVARAQQMIKVTQDDAQRVAQMQPGDPKIAAIAQKHGYGSITDPQVLADNLNRKAEGYQIRVHNEKVRELRRQPLPGQAVGYQATQKGADTLAENLIKIADEYDKSGMHKEASEIDGLIKEAQWAESLGKGLGKGLGGYNPWNAVKNVMQPIQTAPKAVGGSGVVGAVKNVMQPIQTAAKAVGGSDLPRAQQMLQVAQVDAQRVGQMQANDPKVAAIAKKHGVNITDPTQLASRLNQKANMYKQQIAKLQAQQNVGQLAKGVAGAATQMAGGAKA